MAEEWQFQFVTSFVDFSFSISIPLSTHTFKHIFGAGFSQSTHFATQEGQTFYSESLFFLSLSPETFLSKTLNQYPPFKQAVLANQLIYLREKRKNPSNHCSSEDVSANNAAKYQDLDIG